MIKAQLRKLYQGFPITTPTGNNAFSHAQRKHKAIWVPPLREGTADDLQPGNEIVFCEIEEGVEKACRGLKHFVHWQVAEKDIFIFDNHNHAFFFWCWLYQKWGSLPFILHVDQHRDMREPENKPPADLLSNLQSAFDYCNYQLNVGNFIIPALESGLIPDVKIVDSSATLEQEYEPPFILDLDIDFFAPELDYMGMEKKQRRVVQWLQDAEAVTIATSPFFMDQSNAITIVKQLCKEAFGK